MIYYIDEIDHIDEILLKQLMPYLPLERQDYASQYRFRIDQVQSILAYILLRIGLFEECGYRDVPKLAVSSARKPLLIEPKGIFFNMSHCKKGVACGIADCELGVDIQHYVEFKERVANYFMSRSEILAVKAGNSTLEFTRLWTLKESYGKYTGEGICFDMQGRTIVENVFMNGVISQSHQFENFVISVTSAKSIELREVRTEELLDECCLLKQAIIG